MFLCRGEGRGEQGKGGEGRGGEGRGRWKLGDIPTEARGDIHTRAETALCDRRESSHSAARLSTERSVKHRDERLSEGGAELATRAKMSPTKPQ